MAKKQGLSQRQWLNVMTIAIAFMILLFTIVGKIFEERSNAINRPFAAAEGIRIGNWQATVDNQLNCQQQPQVLTWQECRQLFLAWRNLVAAPQELSDQQIETESVLNISLQQVTWQNYRFQLEPRPRLVEVEHSVSYFIADNDVGQLFPSSLLSYLSKSP